MDKEVDHGPILIQKETHIERNAEGLYLDYADTEKILAIEATEIFSKILNNFLIGMITPNTQDDTCATFTKMITKEDGLINLSDNAHQNFLKYLA